MKLERSFWEKIVPWVVLVFMGFYTYGFLFQAPYAGFSYNQEGVVTEVFAPATGEMLQEGDQLQQVGSLAWDDFRANRTQRLFEGVRAGDRVALQLRRNGKVETVEWAFPGRSGVELRQRVNSEWWLPYVFWLAGAATIWLIRPKGRRWRLLMGFHFLTAVWLVTGSLSSSHLWHSIFVSHAALWLCLPVYWQLHFMYPQPLFSPPKWLFPAFYAVAVLLAVLEWPNWLPPSAYSVGALLAFGGSVVLLIIQAWRSARGSEVRWLLIVLGLSFVPTIIMILVSPLFRGGALLSVVAIPGSYFMAAYRPQLQSLRNRVRRLVKLYVVAIVGLTVLTVGLSLFVNWIEPNVSTLQWGNVTMMLSLVLAVLGFLPILGLAALSGAYYRTAVDSPARQLELVANRLFMPYLFVIFVVPFLILLAIGLQLASASSTEAVLISMVSSLTAVSITLLSYKRFQQLVEQYLFGLPPLPTAMVEMYMNRLVTTKNRATLVQLLRDEVLRALQVRESALFLVDEARQVELLYQDGLDEAVLPPLPQVLAAVHRLQQEQPVGWSGVYDWVQLVLPLRVQEQWVGLWLLGRRDPDGLYGQRDVPLYETLAAQTAVGLINFTQAETLQLLYKANIERHEQERLWLAHDLHDVTLSQLGVMAMYVEDGVSPKFHQLYREITHHLRQVITGLRPKMLDFGLWAGLNQLVDVSTERLLPKCELLFDLRQTAVRYPVHIEQEIYRIVQQALENALHYSQAELIRIHGHLEENDICIVVEDSGVGFAYDGQLPIAKLLSEGHFGLVGMQERAAFIGAQMQLDSNPSEGTLISVVWQPPKVES